MQFNSGFPLLRPISDSVELPFVSHFRNALDRLTEERPKDKAEMDAFMQALEVVGSEDSVHELRKTYAPWTISKTVERNRIDIFQLRL